MTTRTFVIRMTTDNPDAELLARDAAADTVTRVEWGDEYNTSIELVQEDEGLPDFHLSSWIMEPGEGDDEGEESGQ